MKRRHQEGKVRKGNAPKKETQLQHFAVDQDANEVETAVSDPGKFLCIQCKRYIGRTEHCIDRKSPPATSSEEMCLGGTKVVLQTFVNPTGEISKVIVLSDATVKEDSEIYHEFTWFKGFSWRVCRCRHCQHLIGWKYENIEKCEQFYGIIMSCIWNIDYKKITTEFCFDRIWERAKDLNLKLMTRPSQIYNKSRHDETFQIVRMRHGKIIMEKLEDIAGDIQLEHGNFFELLQEKGLLTGDQIKQVRSKDENDNQLALRKGKIALKTIAGHSSAQFRVFLDTFTETIEEHIIDRYFRSFVEKQMPKRLRQLLARQYARRFSEFPMLKTGMKKGDMMNLYKPILLQDMPTWNQSYDCETYEDYSLLFQGKYGRPTNKVLLMGEPGTGKSFLLRKLALDWSCAIHNDCASENQYAFVSQFHLVLLIELNRIHHDATLQDILKEQLCSSEEAQSIYDYMNEKQDCCLILLDAWDEFHTKGINEFENLACFNNVYMIITSRFQHLDNLPKLVDKQVQSLGFSKDSVTKFISAIVPEDTDHNIVKNLTETKQIKEFLYVPLFTHYFCVLGINYTSLDCLSLTNIFIRIVQFLIGYSTRNLQPFVARSSLGPKRKMLLQIGRLALEGLLSKQQTLLFTKSEIGTSVDEHVSLLHLVNTKDSSDIAEPLYAFHHKMMQEFMAALYIAHDEIYLNIFMNELDNVQFMDKFQFVILFVCGLSPSLGGPSLLAKIKNSSSHTICPSFNRWVSDVSDMDVEQNKLAACLAIGDTHFVAFQVRCCLEMFGNSSGDSPGMCSFHRGNHRFIFPTVFDFSYISPTLLALAINDGFITFHNDNRAIQIDNLTITKSNMKDLEKVVTHSMCKIRHTVDIKNIKCDHGADVGTNDWLLNMDHAFFCSILDVTLCNKDMANMLRKLGSFTNMKTLFMYKASGGNKVTELQDQLCKLTALNGLVLSAIAIPIHQRGLCDSIKQLVKLTKLALCQLDLSSAEEALAAAINCLPCLDCLDLHETNLTREQVDQVSQAVSQKCTSLSFFDISGNVAVGKEHKKICACVSNLPTLLTFGIQNCNVLSCNLLEILNSLPTSIMYIFSAENKGNANIRQLKVVLKNHKLLKHISLDVEQKNKETLEDVFEETKIKALFVEDENTRFQSDVIKKAINISQHLSQNSSQNTYLIHDNCICKCAKTSYIDKVFKLLELLRFLMMLLIIFYLHVSQN